MRSLLFLLAISLPVFSQNKEAPPPKNETDTSVTVKFLAEQAPEQLGQVFLLLEKTKTAPLTLPTNQFSNPIPVPSRVMVLKTVEKEVPLCTITLPELGKSFAVVLVTAKPAGFTPIVVRTDDPSFKEGDVFFINRSQHIVLGKLGTTPLILKPGESTKSHPTSPVDGAYYNIAFAVRQPEGDKLISSSRWPIDKNLRSYVFFFTGADGSTNYRAVDEYMAVP